MTDSDTKESFCGACAALPLALVGTGVAGAGSKKKGSNKKTKKILLWSGLAITLISIIIVIFYLKRCKTCNA